MYFSFPSSHFSIQASLPKNKITTARKTYQFTSNSRCKIIPAVKSAIYQPCIKNTYIVANLEANLEQYNQK